MAEANTFAIVKFIDEDDALDIILSWLAADYATCYYPESKTDQMRERLIKDDVSPQNKAYKWVICKVHVIVTTFALARSNLKKAEETSGLDPEPDLKKKIPRRKIKKATVLLPGEKAAPARENRKLAAVLQWMADITGRLEKIEERLEAIAQIHVPIAEEDDTSIFSLLALKSLDYFGLNW
ncbi:Hypothetical predicted protein [Pelobates cultripes]|uniref:Uncharacterized protein n=1 Tax=Pelobates cultripes TaxID=61616 RepID=A0AAD1R3N6_PELCU|nr:Hypothetical predicted protein [Pelobates cultripes]